MLTMALPNGTLEARTMAFFEKAGIKLGRTPRCYEAYVDDPRIARVSFMRPQIIPYLVSRGRYDLAVVGSDVVADSDYSPTILGKLDFSGRGENREFRVVLLGHQEDSVANIGDIPDGSAILSEYPNMTKRALIEAKIRRAFVTPSFGTTEANVPHDFRFGVCIASTEETLRANNLKVIHVLSVETTVVIGGLSRLDGGEKEAAARSLLEDLMKVADLS
jgi:ATP phosphoribosyltransferase